MTGYQQEGKLRLNVMQKTPFGDAICGLWECKRTRIASREAAKRVGKGRNARAKGCFTQFRMLNLTFQKYGFNINTRQ